MVHLCVLVDEWSIYLHLLMVGPYIALVDDWSIYLLLVDEGSIVFVLITFQVQMRLLTML